MRGDPDLDMSIDPQPYAAESQPAPVPVTPENGMLIQPSPLDAELRELQRLRYREARLSAIVQEMRQMIVEMEREGVKGWPNMISDWAAELAEGDAK